MNEQPGQRTLLILASALDMIISGVILLIYFGLLPVDTSGWGIPRRVIGVVGGVWFAGAMAVLLYQLRKTDGAG
jgi:hypothetical protein